MKTLTFTEIEHCLGNKDSESFSYRQYALNIETTGHTQNSYYGTQKLMQFFEIEKSVTLCPLCFYLR